MTDDRNVVVLGTGMAALGAAHRLHELGITCALYDEKSYIGGHTATFSSGDGFRFDEGPHVSFTRDNRIRDLFAQNVDGAYREVDAMINNYWRGHWIQHPAQLNLHGLPTDLIVDVVTDLVDQRSKPDRPVLNYEEWLIEAFGATFARTFPIPYNRKYQTTEPRNLTTDWLGPRMYRPQLDEVLRGAVAPQEHNVHYVSQFRYPVNGGFAAYVEPLAAPHQVHLDHRVVGVDPSEHIVRFANGSVVGYREIVSSIPLPKLVPLIDGVPDYVRAAAQRLSYSSVLVVNIGVDRPDLSDAQISYIYDEDVVFSRLNFPHMLSPRNAPDGHGSVQAEIYSSRYRPRRARADQLTDQTIADLQRIGVLREDDAIVHRSAIDVPFANIIYDFDRTEALEQVDEYLDEAGIRRCGRYGEWNHAWTDEAFISGENAVNRFA